MRKLIVKPYCRCIFIVFVILVSCLFSPKNVYSNGKLEVFFHKNKFKLFEPIDVLVKYINNEIENDSLYLILDDHREYLNFNIQDDKGNRYNYNNGFDPRPDYITLARPSFVVRPGDTAIGVVNLTQFGKSTLSKDSLFWTWQTGCYFPVGKYTGYAYANQDANKTYKQPLISAPFEFEVLELSEEDYKILKLSEEHKITEIIDNFDKNSLIVYAYEEKVRQVQNKQTKGELTESEFASVLHEFIRKFSDSYFGIHYVWNYISIISAKDKQSIISNIDNLIKEIPDSEISSFLSNRLMRKQIVKSILKKNY